MGWRVSASGVITSLEAAPAVVKKLKLVGHPFKVIPLMPHLRQPLHGLGVAVHLLILTCTFLALQLDDVAAWVDGNRLLVSQLLQSYMTRIRRAVSDLIADHDREEPFQYAVCEQSTPRPCQF
jgi:hypothetical protein